MIYYVQINAMCMLLLLGLYLYLMKKNSAKPTERKAYGNLVKATILLCISDMVGGLFNGKSFSGVRLILHISNSLYFFATTLISFIWLVYVLLRTKGLNHDYRRIVWYLSIPLIVFSLFLVANPWTKYLFYIDDSNTYVRGPGVFIHWIFSWGYLAAATVVAIVALCKKENSKRRAELRPLVTFIVFPVIGAIVQILFYGVSALQCGITLSIIITLFSSVSKEISLDSLTGLNNRFAMNQYISFLMERGQQHLTVLMMDINQFKTINDNAGHAAGDMALIGFSRLLKNVCGESSHSLFLYRYGGDEFVIIGRNMNDQDSSGLISNLEAATRKFNDENPDLYIPLSFSLGKVTGKCSSGEDVDELLKLADQEMYRNKKKSISR